MKNIVRKIALICLVFALLPLGTGVFAYDEDFVTKIGVVPAELSPDACVTREVFASGVAHMLASGSDFNSEKSSYADVSEDNFMGTDQWVPISFLDSGKKYMVQYEALSNTADLYGKSLVRYGKYWIIKQGNSGVADMVLADADGDLRLLADATPRGVHRIRGFVLCVGAEDQDGHRVQPGLCSKAFSHFPSPFSSFI